MIKVFGLGNIIYGDEGIGIKVVEEIREKIKKYEDKVEIIICNSEEKEYLKNINDDDNVILVDSTYFMTRPGAITVKSLEECDEFIRFGYTVDEESLLSLLRKEKRNVNGCLIGIEIYDMSQSAELSKNLKKKFNGICDRVYEEIMKIIA